MTYKINKLTYDDENGIIINNGKEVQLTKIQKKLLDYFIAHPKCIITKQVLMDDVWERVVNDNSINKIISKLRNIIEEDPKNPKVIITTFGHGISFESNAIHLSSEPKKINNSKPYKTLLFSGLIILAVIVFFWNQDKQQAVSQPTIIDNIKINQPLLIVPAVFNNKFNKTLQEGSNEMVKASLLDLDSTAEILFSNSNDFNEKTLRKYWDFDKNLVILQTKVINNEGLYEAVMEFSVDFKLIKSITFSTKNLMQLANKQVKTISAFHDGITAISAKHIIRNKKGEKYLQALGYKKSGDLESAKKVARELLSQRKKPPKVQLLLSQILLEQNEYDKSLILATALKKTAFYKTRSSSIEYLIALSLSKQQQNQTLITGIDNYLDSHLDIFSNYKMSNFLLLKAKAYAELGNTDEALKLYQLSIEKLNDNFYPEVFAASFLGQAKIFEQQSFIEKAKELSNKAVGYRKKPKLFL